MSQEPRIGFTFVEIMTVLALIAVLVVIAERRHTSLERPQTHPSRFASGCSNVIRAERKDVWLYPIALTKNSISW